MDYMPIIARFNALYQPLNALQKKVAQAIIESDAYPFWSLSGDRQQAADYITEFEYLSDDSVAGSTTYFPALIGLPISICQLIADINIKRSQLIALLRDMDQYTTDDGIKLSHYILDKVQLRRLNRKATARKFIELSCKPDSVSYLWSQARSIRKLTVDDAVKSIARRITKMNDSALRQQLLLEQQKLLLLEPTEIVARVNIDSPQPRVNMLIKGKRWPGKTAMMPIFFPATKDEQLPLLQALSKSIPDRQRLKRSDSTIENTAYAPLAKIYRYK